MNKLYNSLYAIENELEKINKYIYQIYLITETSNCTSQSPEDKKETDYPITHPILKNIQRSLESLGSKWTDIVLKKKFLESLTPSGYPEYPYKRIEEHGYVKLYKDPWDNSFKNTRYEHRYIMDKSVGRKLNPKEFVHHIDGNKKNNKLPNLKIVSPTEHHTIHHKRLR